MGNVDELINEGHHFLAKSLPVTDAYLDACKDINMFDLLIDFNEQDSRPAIPLTPWLFVNVLNCLGPTLYGQLVEPVIESRRGSIDASDQRLGALATGLLYPAQGKSSTIFSASGGTVTCPCQPDFTTLVEQTRQLDDRLPSYAFTAVPWAMYVRNPVDDNIGCELRITIIDASSWAHTVHLFMPIDHEQAWHTRPAKTYPWEVHSPAYNHLNTLRRDIAWPNLRHKRDIPNVDFNDPPINYN